MQTISANFRAISSGVIKKNGAGHVILCGECYWDNILTCFLENIGAISTCVMNIIGAISSSIVKNIRPMLPSFMNIIAWIGRTKMSSP